MNAIVVDIGGTSIRVGLSSSAPSAVRRIAAPAAYEDLVAIIAQQVAESDSSAAKPMFVACPGLVSQHGVVTKALYSCVSGHDLRRDLEDRLDREVTVSNDAKAQAFGGYGDYPGVVVYITVGTAVGGAVLDGGRVWGGSRGYAFEIGHIPSTGASAECVCGKVGCVDTLVAGRSIDHDLGKHWYRGPPAKYVSRLREAAYALAEACWTAVTLFDPSVLAINSRLLQFPAFTDALTSRLARPTLEARPVVVFSDASWSFTARWADYLLKERTA